ncbi:MAG: hypothetical protein KDI33_01860 [Halioglobus sp.]|nr:hypothetical protein [Halioglobus sp.]
MNWEAIGALGETFGAFLVLITLIYLATQVRYAKNAAADANRLARARGVCDLQLITATNDQLNQSNIAANGWIGWYRELADARGITVEDAIRADAMSTYWFWLHWGQFASTNNKKDLAELGDTIGKFYQSPAIKYSWDNGPFSKPLLGREFIEFVEEYMGKFAH